ncbi:glycosyltransferase family 4 protein [Chthonobacter rhizosphaerae]|uniref:glycosyltransferase family 4 protein n=1 Tax=Chthonobacter rhizosphaerae TaxID=2735553 RepID=UPI0015EEFF3B|nr:glycosyltransferase family 4 protein [Chthonobacter rhizosphaerae]
MPGPKPLRIIHCVRSPVGGIFRHIVDLATAQEAAGHQVGIICDSVTGGAFEAGVIADLAPRLTFGVRRFPMERRVSADDVRATIRLLSHLRGLELDVLHGHGAKGGAYARLIGTALRFFGRRVLRVYCPHGGSLHFDAGTREGRAYFTLERMLENVTDGFVFVSGYEETSYRDKVSWPERPVRRVLNGLKPEEYEPVTAVEGAADLLYMGVMRDLKGPQVLIESLKILAEDYDLTPTVRFLGDGPDRPAYERTVRDLGFDNRVTFKDPLPTRQALAEGRVLVVPSLAESMPYVVLEAIAARIPLIATRVGGIPEIFGDRSGALVQPGDAPALAAAISRTLWNETAARDEAAAFGRDLAGRFSLERMSADIEDFYTELADARRRSTAGEPATGGALIGGAAASGGQALPGGVSIPGGAGRPFASPGQS